LKRFNKKPEAPCTRKAAHCSSKKSRVVPFFQWLGIHNEEIYNSAKSVLEKRSVPLIAAMDQGLIEPDEAACITSLSIKKLHLNIHLNI
jgi:hypothetical protein